MHQTAAREMCLEKFHLIRQHAFTLQVNVLGVCRGKRYRQQLHVRLLRTAPGLVVVATSARSHHIGPAIQSIPTDRCDVISRQIP